MKHQPEFILQCHVCKYLRTKYPKVLFLTDSIAAVKLTIPQQQRNKKVQKPDFKCPDLLILQPNNMYCGLFIELKVETPFKLNGEIKASTNDHLKKQAETIERLNKLGYRALFLWDFDMIKKEIDSYLEKY